MCLRPYDNTTIQLAETTIKAGTIWEDMYYAAIKYCFIDQSALCTFKL
jgi:hypothetical protein